jgi:hypothetical protein
MGFIYTVVELQNIFYAVKSMYSVKCEIFLSDFNKIGASQQNLVKVPSVKLHNNPSIGARADTRGQTDGRRDMTKRKASYAAHANAH